MKKTLLVAMLIVATSCTRMEQFFPNGIKTEVNGEEFLVLSHGKDNYQAMPNDPSLYNFWTRDARASANNVKAIEQVSGCKVIRESIQNNETTTAAAVVC